MNTVKQNSKSSQAIGLLARIWYSPTFNSWGSHGARAMGMVIILPFVLTKLSTTEIAIWFLFSTIIGLQLLIDSGFSITFARSISYGMGGATELKDLRDSGIKGTSGKPNWSLIVSIVGTMHSIYFWLGWGWVLLLSGAGTWSVSGLVLELDSPLLGWLAWSVVVATSGFRMFGARFSSYLTGVNEIAVLRRWEAIIWLAMIPANILVLVLDGGILGLVLVSQSFVTLNVFVNRWLVRSVCNGRLSKLNETKFETEIFSKIWPLVWRSGIGIFMSAGVVQISGIVYAQFGSTDEVASYLFALNIIRSLAQFSQAPFYSKLPVLARLRAEGKLEEQVRLAKRGMSFSHWALVLGIVVLGLLGEPFVEFIKANASFVSSELWALMGFAVFLERYGAMHLQLYSTTNHIVWHIANGITGLIYIVCVVPIFMLIGVFAIPLSQIISNILFYDWYCARKSYKAFSLSATKFEVSTSLFPLLALSSYVFLMITANN